MGKGRGRENKERRQISETYIGFEFLKEKTERGKWSRNGKTEKKKI